MARTDLGGEYEDFPTPGWCVDRLLERVWLPGGVWLEPCAGHGAMVDRILHRRDDVRIHANDFQHHNEDAIRAAGADTVETGWNAQRHAFGPRWLFDVVITNPPFSLAAEIVANMRAHAPIVAMLLRLNFLGSAKRYSLWDELRPSEVWVLPNRPVFRGEHSDSQEYAWFIWRPGRVPNGETRLGHLGVTSRDERMRLRARARAASWRAEWTGC